MGYVTYPIFIHATPSPASAAFSASTSVTVSSSKRHLWVEGLIDTVHPWKMNMEPENHLFEKGIVFFETCMTLGSSRFILGCTYKELPCHLVPFLLVTFCSTMTTTAFFGSAVSGKSCGIKYHKQGSGCERTFTVWVAVGSVLEANGKKKYHQNHVYRVVKTSHESHIGITRCFKKTFGITQK